MNLIASLEKLSPKRFKTSAILKKQALASSKLAELKGVAASINQDILINILGLQEARDSAAIDNIMMTDDELFKGELFPENLTYPAVREVLRYREALRLGFEQVSWSGSLTRDHIIQIQAVLAQNNKSSETPQAFELLSGFDHFITRFAADPLIKMALLNPFFENAHPFYQANGQTGRIVNILYLVKEGLLDIPALYLSRYIARTKADHDRLLQDILEKDAWEDWVHYMLTITEVAASDTIQTIHAIKLALLNARHRMRAQYPFYSEDLIYHLFIHPYTNAELIEENLKVSRQTAFQYLDALTEDGFLQKRETGYSHYYINLALNVILTGKAMRKEAL
ncbi:MAG: Fic/DOC family N-terminal domain-containing protein [Methylococcales bacterium]|nr:Fic/DOC family N-terminal domain-containing protein [Methylococcales bacterium]